MQDSFSAALFAVPLVDLADHEDTHFAGVMTPLPEVGAARPGTSATFLENAEAYYQRHQNFTYLRHALREALSAAGVSEAHSIVEYGCGFGNATMPILEIFPNANVVASDISPNLLAILHRLLVARGMRDRCVPIALDAHKPYVKAGTADLVVGSAILHHLADPGVLIQAAMRVLKPGGWAIFFEPLEAGHAILRLAIREICQQAAIREFASPALTWLAEIAVEWMLQIKRDQLPGWRDIDDKWLFPRSVLQNFADEAGAELMIRPVSGRDANAPFADFLKQILKDWVRLDPDDEQQMPPWSWEIISRYDNEFFSGGLKADIAFAGTVMFRKR